MDREPADVFDTVLVANRGEIARRIIRTLRRLGIRSVTVYSDADATEPHVREADAAYRIGPAQAAQSYLNAEAILAAARESGAQAIHPGYGFLSENTAFARACEAAGIVFIGPGERALEVMGDKIRSKAHVAAHGVPVVPGIDATGMTDAQIATAAAEVGYPLLIKPSAGGGGKGMQIVHAETELIEALATARRVAASAFGDDTLLLERLIERPRHIEVQVIADATGEVIHLGERECTLQRRHQKVIEEAPSPIVDALTRARLGAAACAAAASVDYRGAGTVEFLVAADSPDEFFFIEMNTRLQVEHPVTELVTGLDLVELQVRVAAGLPIGLTQDDVRLRGHAIEARVYAESPSHGFLPATGDVLVWTPAGGLRTDAAIETGSTVTAHYDPMLAKVIAHGADRAEALTRLDEGLRDTVLLGVDANTAFLRALVADPAVQSGDLDTGLIDRLPPFADPSPSRAALQAAAQLVPRHPRSHRSEASPLWLARSGWRLSAPAAPTRAHFEDEAGDVHAFDLPAFDLPAFESGTSGRLPLVEATTPATLRPVHPDGPPESGTSGRLGSPDATIGAAFAGRVDVVTAADGWIWVHADGVTSRLRPLTRREAMERQLAERENAGAAAAPELRAPMPGTVVAIHVADGARVVAGERIVTIEAMKMEQSIAAPHGGLVAVDVAVGDQVSRDQVLAIVRVDTAG